jgi:hypothetical protein
VFVLHEALSKAKRNKSFWVVAAYACMQELQEAILREKRTCPGEQATQGGLVPRMQGNAHNDLPQHSAQESEQANLCDCATEGSCLS